MRVFCFVLLFSVSIPTKYKIIKIQTIKARHKPVARWHLLTNLGWYLLATHRGVVNDKADGASNCLSRISPLSRLQLVCVYSRVCANHMCNAQQCSFLCSVFCCFDLFLACVVLKLKNKIFKNQRPAMMHVFVFSGVN